jgi:hypothetical protein
MSATKIAAAYERWHELYTAQYSDDRVPDALAEELDALHDRIVDMRAVCLPDVLAKVSMLREMEKGGEVIGDYVLASIAADLEHATTASPQLVALANELAIAVDRFNNSNPSEDGPNVLAEANNRIWAEIEAFAPRSIADVLAKCHAGALYLRRGHREGRRGNVCERSHRAAEDRRPRTPRRSGEPIARHRRLEHRG